MFFSSVLSTFAPKRKCTFYLLKLRPKFWLLTIATFISIVDTWSEVEIPLKIVQTAAVLEVLHSMVGLVKSPWVTALMQGE